jgi:hypothetical protein
MGSAATAAGIKGLGDVAPHVEAAAVEIGQKFGVTNIGGRASSGHINGSDHYTGHAIDVMVYKDKTKGDAVMNYALSNWDRLGIKYVIWYHVYHPSPTKTENYIGPNPHTDHVHISFNSKPGSGGPAVDTGSETSGPDLQGCLSKLIPGLG